MTTTTRTPRAMVHIDHTAPDCTLIMILPGLLPGSEPFEPKADAHGDPLTDFIIWRSMRQGWIISANTRDIDARQKRENAVAAALRMAGVNRKDTTRFHVTEEWEYARR